MLRNGHGTYRINMRNNGTQICKNRFWIITHLLGLRDQYKVKKF
jgi:hypothetical protein